MGYFLNDLITIVWQSFQTYGGPTDDLISFSVSIKYSEVLRKVNTTVITNEECEQLFSSSNLSINQDVICTSGGQGVGACPVSNLQALSQLELWWTYHKITFDNVDI